MDLSVLLHKPHFEILDITILNMVTLCRLPHFQNFIGIYIDMSLVSSPWYSYRGFVGIVDDDRNRAVFVRYSYSYEQEGTSTVLTYCTFSDSQRSPCWSKHDDAMW